MKYTPAFPRIKKHKKKVIKKLIKKSTLKNKADKLQSLIVRKIGVCEWCGGLKNLQAAHVVTRANLRLRYCIDNLLCLCAGCHLKWHHDPLEAMLWFNTTWPERATYLLKEKNIIRKMTIQDYQKIIKELSDYI
jgi:5-methylcytosine-specific restriction endonuclease McrA